MTDAIVKVMVEVLGIIAIATKEIKDNRARSKDIEDALQRLENVTVEEARMAAAEALKAIHGVGNQVGNKVLGVHDTLKVVEDRMRGVEGMLQGVGDMLQGVDDRIKDIDNKVATGVEKSGRQTANGFDVETAEVRKMMHGVDSQLESVDDIVDIQGGVSDGAEKTTDGKRLRRFNPFVTFTTRHRPERLKHSLETCLSIQDFVEWLSLPDLSVNYNNIAHEVHHRSTALWFTKSSTFRDWKEYRSLLWVYGKFGGIGRPFRLHVF